MVVCEHYGIFGILIRVLGVGGLLAHFPAISEHTMGWLIMPTIDGELGFSKQCRTWGKIKYPSGFFTLPNSLKASNCQSGKNANYIRSAGFALRVSASRLIKLICLIHQPWTFHSRVSGVLGSFRSALAYADEKGNRDCDWKCHRYMRDSVRTRRDMQIIWGAVFLP